MKIDGLREAMQRVSAVMEKNKEYLVELDQLNGDGDLGISMSAGFRAVMEYLEQTEETDLGKAMMGAGGAFNEVAPSSLGTILSIGFMGMARIWRGKQEVCVEEIAEAFQAGLDNVMKKTGTKPGERTVLDSLCPAVEAYCKHISTPEEAIKAAKIAAVVGAEATRQMRPVHGRAAYYGEKSLGQLDGGAVVGQLIFEALAGENG